MIAHWIIAHLQFLGIQEAPRKRRVDQGPWAGTICLTNNYEVARTVHVSKWEKGRRYIKDLIELFKKEPKNSVCYKHLEVVQGFLCHLGMTFEIFMPYLKGFHLTLAQHLSFRNKEGWKILEDDWQDLLEEQLNKHAISKEMYEDLLNQDTNSPPPKQVKPAPLFHKCLATLNTFFSLKEPPKVLDRTRRVSLVLYGFVDALKTDFGGMIDDGKVVQYRIGTWGSDKDDESSNWREFSNLVETLEEEAHSGLLDSSRLIIATDNKAVEGCFYKGNSSSCKLYDLVVWIRTLELKTSMKIFVTHVTGERMKCQCTDGLFRGQLQEGVSLGETMLKYCPWGKTASERSPTLRRWISTWLKDHEFLQPNEWFTRGHDFWRGDYDSQGFWRMKTKKGTFVWEPPPAAADLAMEQLRIARIKRRESTHVIMIPSLFTHIWKKQCSKACDIVIEITAGKQYWSHDQFETLTIGFCFPFLLSYPWQLRHTPKIFAMERKLRRMFKEHSVAGGDILRKFLEEIRGWYSMPSSVVRKLLFFRRENNLPHETFRSRPHVLQRRGGKGTTYKRVGESPSPEEGLPIRKKWRPSPGAV